MIWTKTNNKFNFHYLLNWLALDRVPWGVLVPTPDWLASMVDWSSLLLGTRLGESSRLDRLELRRGFSRVL